MKALGEFTIYLCISTVSFFSHISAGAEHNTKTEKLTLIQIGDLHGELESRPNLREDSADYLEESGVARLYTAIQKIREKDKGALLFYIGDTLQGGAEFQAYFVESSLYFCTNSSSVVRSLNIRCHK